MNNLFEYIKVYGNKSFNELSTTEIDNLIFSQLSYFDFLDIVSPNDNKITIKEAITTLLNKRGIIESLNRKKLLNAIKDSPRYKDLTLSNYTSILTEEEQFSAITIDINDKLSCISYEGTDDTIIGWKEDFTMSYKDKIPAQVDATKYLNKIAKVKKELILTGHSKGGNLAVFAAIYSNLATKKKIKAIYSNDGPGLNDKTIKSLNYKLIKNKITKFIPNNSIVGLLFNTEDNLIIISSPYLGIKAHSVFHWKTYKTNLERAKLSPTSINIKTNLNKWISSYSNEDKELFCNYLFAILKENNINYTKDLTKLSPKQLENIFKQTKKTSPLVKKMYQEFFYFIKSSFILNSTK